MLADAVLTSSLCHLAVHHRNDGNIQKTKKEIEHVHHSNCSFGLPQQIAQGHGNSNEEHHIIISREQQKHSQTGLVRRDIENTEMTQLRKNQKYHNKNRFTLCTRPMMPTL